MNKSNVINLLITLRCAGYAGVVLAVVIGIGGLILATTGLGSYTTQTLFVATKLVAVVGIPGAMLAVLSRLTEFFVRRARFEQTHHQPHN